MDFDDFDDESQEAKPKSTPKENYPLKSMNEDVNIDISDNKHNNVFNILDNKLYSQIDNISESSNVPSSVHSGVQEFDAHHEQDNINIQQG